MPHLVVYVIASGVAVILGLLLPLYIGPLSRIPGSTSFALSKWRLAYSEWSNSRTRTIDRLHRKYGPVVRTGPNQVHFNSLAALRTIYRAGSGFGRTNFYRMFDVYGEQNLFTFHSDKLHGERKRLLSNAYAKSTVLREPTATMIAEKINDYLGLIEHSNEGNDIYWSLHYFSLDVITNFLYGADCGGTSALRGSKEHRALLYDIANPGRRKMTWYLLHFPVYTQWLYSLDGLAGRCIAPFLPMQKPVPYTGIRAHALAAMQACQKAFVTGKMSTESMQTACGRLFTAVEKGAVDLSDLEIASECADHFLAGIDTTSDTLMYLIWALSQPRNHKQQLRMIEEARSIPQSALDAFGNPTAEVADRLPYLNALIMETLRLYAPIPESEPRQSVVDTVIDGYRIPSGTVVGMSPYSLHRNESIFPEPLEWLPERWLGDGAEVAEMKKWWWAFSSGGRMCIGKHLALAEFALVPAIYRQYSTRIKPGFEGVTPAITSRVETFFDETFAKKAVRRPIKNMILANALKELTCWIEFIPRQN